MSERVGSDIERLRILNVNSYLYRFKIDWIWRHWNSESFYVGSDLFRHWFLKIEKTDLELLQSGAFENINFESIEFTLSNFHLIIIGLVSFVFLMIDDYLDSTTSTTKHSHSSACWDKLLLKSVYSDKGLIGLYFRNLSKGSLITCKFDYWRMVHRWPFIENHQEYQGTVEQYWFSDN